MKKQLLILVLCTSALSLQAMDAEMPADGGFEAFLAYLDTDAPAEVATGPDLATETAAAFGPGELEALALSLPPVLPEYVIGHRPDGSEVYATGWRQGLEHGFALCAKAKNRTELVLGLQQMQMATQQGLNGSAKTSGQAFTYFLLSSYFLGVDVSALGFSARIDLTKAAPGSREYLALCVLKKVAELTPALLSGLYTPEQVAELRSISECEPYTLILRNEYRRKNGLALIVPTAPVFKYSRSYALWQKFVRFESILEDAGLSRAVSLAALSLPRNKSAVTLVYSGSDGEKTGSADRLGSSDDEDEVRRAVWNTPSRQHEYMADSSPKKPSVVGQGRGKGPRALRIIKVTADEREKKKCARAKATRSRRARKPKAPYSPTLARVPKQKPVAAPAPAVPSGARRRRLNKDGDAGLVGPPPAVIRDTNWGQFVDTKTGEPLDKKRKSKS